MIVGPHGRAVCNGHHSSCRGAWPGAGITIIPLMKCSAQRHSVCGQITPDCYPGLLIFRPFRPGRAVQEIGFRAAGDGATPSDPATEKQKVRCLENRDFRWPPIVLRFLTGVFLYSLPVPAEAGKSPQPCIAPKNHEVIFTTASLRLCEKKIIHGKYSIILNPNTPDQ